VDSQREIISLLRAELVQAQMKNSSFSLRGLARKLKSNPSTLSEILNGKRPITKRTGKKLLEALCVNPAKANQIVSKLPNRHLNGKDVGSQTDTYTQISADHFDVIANWYYYGILSLVETKGFKSDYKWIAQKLGLNLQKTKRSVKKLVELGMLQQTKSGKIRSTRKKFKTSSDILDLSIQKNHMQNLEIQENSLVNDPVELRDFSSITFTFNPKKMKKAKEMIRDFRRQFSEEMENKNNTEVYRLSVQLIPLSKEIKQ
jgi:transcriptional regulator with XRE-family HTH domain